MNIVKRLLGRILLRREGGVSKGKAGAVVGFGAGSALVLAVRQWLLSEYGIEVPAEVLAGVLGTIAAAALSLFGIRDKQDTSG